MSKTFCRECGHILPFSNSRCPSCGWDENEDQYPGDADFYNLDEYFGSDYRPDQIHGY